MTKVMKKEIKKAQVEVSEYEFECPYCHKNNYLSSWEISPEENKCEECGKEVILEFVN